MTLNATNTPGYPFAASGGATPSADTEPLSYLYPRHSSAVAASLIATADALANPRGKDIYAPEETIEGINAKSKEGLH